MHNLAMAENLLNVVLSEAAKHEGKRIQRISVVLDDHDFAEAEAMQFCFEAMAVGTQAEGALMDISRSDNGVESSLPSIVLQLSQ